MTNILDKIVSHKRKEVDIRIESNPLSNFINHIEKSNNSLYESIRQKSVTNNQPAFILECKKASPSKGLINPSFDVQTIAETYSQYASGISVLTDHHFFQGEFDYIRQAKIKTNLPILCKDFFIDSYQVYEARHSGADAILLMLSVLDDKTYRSLSGIASELGLDILTEVHSEEELNRAIELNARIVGINNRNLKDLSISLSTTQVLAEKINDQYDSKNKPIIISESGISGNDDVNKLSHLVDGFLVGSHLMASKQLNKACQNLIYGKIKICGLTKQSDIDTAIQFGATYAGLIFYKNSPRYIEPSEAVSITKNKNIKFVGVFVDDGINNIASTVEQLDLFAVQLHGKEDNRFIDELRKTIPNVAIWKAIPVSASSTLATLAQAINDCHADYILLDTQTSSFGGTGLPFDWKLLENLQSMLNSDITLKNKVILAGGLSPENINQAKNKNCFALDVNSGVEISPGIKSKEKIERLFDQILTRNTIHE